MMADIVECSSSRMLIVSASRAASGSFVEYIRCSRRLRRRLSRRPEHAAVARVESIQLRLPVECEGGAPRALGESPASAYVEGEVDDLACHRIHVVGRNGDAVHLVAQVIGHAARAWRDDGKA